MRVRGTAAWLSFAFAGFASFAALPAHAVPAPAAKPSARVPATKPAAHAATAKRSAPATAAKPTKHAGVKPKSKRTPKVDPASIPSEGVTQLTDWIVATGDNNSMPFMVIDKVAAEVFVHDSEGKLIGATTALFGVTPGDESSPGVGDRELSEIAPEERTTPAGRFVAKFGTASGNRRVLWVDYATSISLHPVITTRKKEHRLERLRSPTPEDNRITYGCINVPTAFYAKVVHPLLRKTNGIVYILPETKPLNQVFLAFRPMPPAPAPAADEPVQEQASR